jgi:serine/threonine-protein kinase
MGPIGHGGMAVVYQAMDARRAEPVALKLLAPALAADPRARDKVRLEALITDRLRHPCVPRVYDVGVAPMPDGSSVPYMAMELLSGVVLAGRLLGGPLPWWEAVATAARIGDVLAVAHRRGIVHRDLTPANVMLTAQGVKSIDFGVATSIVESRPPAVARWASVPARPVRPARRRGAHTAAAQASPAWASRTLAPSVRAGGQRAVTSGAGSASDPADDVYAMGVLLYQMLTGTSPYPSTGPTALLSPNRFRCVAPTPVLLVPGMPREVADICRYCMAKRPGDRPAASMASLALWAVVDRMTSDRASRCA